MYTYCANNPLIYIDPTGHSWLSADDYQAYLSYMERHKEAKKQIEEGKIIDRKMRNDESVEDIVLGSRNLEHGSMLFLQDEVYYNGQLRLEVLGENINEYSKSYSETGEEAYLELLESEYIEYLAKIQTYDELGFRIENFKFVKDDDYYKSLYNIYYREGNFAQWLLLERNLQTLFAEAENYMRSGFELGAMGVLKNMSITMMESSPHSNVNESYNMKVNGQKYFPKDGSQTALKGNGNDFANETFLPDEAYKRNLPKQVQPDTRALPKYDEYGNLKQIKYYDEYGREVGWVDFTDHGYTENHTAPHWHEVQYDSQYPLGRKIDHRTDPNPPFLN